jgi:hypothetical protein
MKPTKLLSILFPGMLFAGITHAQQTANTAGGNATGSGGSASYSVGQPFYTTSTGNSGSVAQGVQHAYEIFSIGIKETALDISIMAYPNPTTDGLTLQINNHFLTMGVI